MTAMQNADFMIIGGGIIGICLSLELKNRYPDSSILVLEKEKSPGLHASGRNSGVLHAGFYYSADSLKAELTRDGNRELTEYCLERQLPINRCGKLVVTKNETELDGLQELMRRGRANGVNVELISVTDAKEIEPKVKTYEQALFSPTTSSVNPAKVMQALYNDAQRVGIQFVTETTYLSHDNNKIRTNQGMITTGYVINAAGLYADKIAKQFGFAKEYTILPFKGVYLYATESKSLNCNVYPVPDFENPFLGVHFTVTVDGNVKIGPTAMPAFWRENYKGLSNLNIKEFLEIMCIETKLLFSNRFNFRKLAIEELKKLNRLVLIASARELVGEIDEKSFTTWGKAGIRAQLFNTKSKTLEMDFCYQGDNHSFHVLNAVSPAFTCAMPFARLMVDKIDQLMH
jgi:L-2-hydroxyglutarate oxidase LhgO